MTTTSPYSWINMVAITIIGLLLTLTVFNGLRFYDLLLQPTTHQQPETVFSTLKPLKKNPSVQTIASWHLFGTSQKNASNAPKTKLKLTLIGIISSTQDGQARAIVEDGSRKQNYYKVGDNIKQNVIVKAIFDDHMVIEHNRKEEVIPLKALKDKNILIKKVAR